MKFNNPLPQVLPKECIKAAKILTSFVDEGRNGLDGIIPRHVLANARGFVVLSVAKAGFLLSARAGSGIVIARLDNGEWSAPSAIGTAGFGFGGQGGAEITDFLIVLNSRSAVRSFMSAGSVTLGGNLSVALGPIGRTGEASASINAHGRAAAMYSYSKTKGLFGGMSIEGSVIVERQDANAIAYNDSVTAQMLLTGAVPPPPWADGLIKTLEHLAPSEPNPKWVKDNPVDEPYAFGGMGSPGSLPKKDKKSTLRSQFPPPSWGTPKNSGSYFDGLGEFGGTTQMKPPTPNPPANDNLIDIRDNRTDAISGGMRATSPGRRMSSPFDTSGADLRVPTDKFTSPFDTSTLVRDLPPASSTSSSSRPQLGRSFSNASASSGMKARAEKLSSQFGNELDAMRRLTGLGGGSSSKPPTPAFKFSSNPAYDWGDGPRASPAPGTPNDQYDYRDSSAFRFQEVDADLDKAGAGVHLPTGVATNAKPKVLRKTSTLSANSSDEDSLGLGTGGGGAKVGRAPSQRFKAALTRKEPDSIGKAVARFEFLAVESGDLSLRKGDIVTILEKSESTDDWWKGRIGEREGAFPANFVEVVENKGAF